MCYVHTFHRANMMANTPYPSTTGRHSSHKVHHTTMTTFRITEEINWPYLCFILEILEINVQGHLRCLHLSCFIMLLDAGRPELEPVQGALTEADWSPGHYIGGSNPGLVSCTSPFYYQLLLIVTFAVLYPLQRWARLSKIDRYRREYRQFLVSIGINWSPVVCSPIHPAPAPANGAQRGAPALVPGPGRRAWGVGGLVGH